MIRPKKGGALRRRRSGVERQGTVTVAVALFTTPHVPVTRTQYVYVPLASFGVVYEAAVAPLIGVVVLGDVPRYHW
jgi:hypothetical protein